MNDKEENNLDKIGFAAGQYGAAASSNYADATDEMVSGIDAFRQAAERLGAVGLHFRQGNLFEYIEAAKFNAEAALKEDALRAHVTAAEGDPTGAADILIKLNGEVVREVQAKSSDSSTALTGYLKDPKYDGMLKLVPEDKANTVRGYAERLAERHSERDLPTAAGHADTAKNVTGRLEHGGVTSGGTNYQENIFAAENPQIYSVLQEMKSVACEAATAGMQAAAAGAVVGCAVSLIKSSIKYSKGEMSLKEAVVKSGEDALKAGGRGGSIGCMGAILRQGAREAGIKSLTKSNVATALAAGLISSGVSVYKYVKGEMSAEETAESIGQNGVSTMSSIYSGAAAGMVFGPAGAVVGSVVGYMVASNVFQACLAIHKNARLANEEKVRIVALCEAACDAMNAQRKEVEAFVIERIEQRKEEFVTSFRDIDECLTTDNYVAINLALADFATLFGRKLLFNEFEEFNEFMLESDLPLTM